MGYLGIVVALTTLLFLVGCGQGEDSYIETPEAETPEVQEREALVPHPSPDQSVDPDRRAKMEEEKRKEEEEQAAEDERSKLGKLLDSLGYALFKENSVEKAKQVIIEIGPLYEKSRKEDEGCSATVIKAADKFKQELDKLTSYLERNDIENAKACFANLGYSWREWRMRKLTAE